jgi:hypothetical protein
MHAMRESLCVCMPRKTSRSASEHCEKLTKEGTPLDQGIPYAELVGALLYLSVMTRPDIAFAVGGLSRFMSSPTVEHWNAAKRVLRYLVGTQRLGIVYRKGESRAVAYGDSDFAGDTDTRKSRSGVVIIKNGGALTWVSRMQSTVATSTCDVQCISGAEAVKHALWVRRLLGELEGQIYPMTVYCDNQSALVLMTKSMMGFSKRKHVDVAYHFVHNRVMRDEVVLEFVSSEEQLADILTKALPAPKFMGLRSAIGIKDS